MDIDGRKRRILAAVIDCYSQTGGAIGSKLLVDILADLSLSSATLRNEMAEMERLGLLVQPHTSAGRVPTEQGYRYYINRICEPVGLTHHDRKELFDRLEENDRDPERAAEQAGRLLSEATGYASVVCTPASGDITAAHFDIMQSASKSAAVICVTNVGGVRTRVCSVPNGFSAADAERARDMLNELMVFVVPTDCERAARRLKAAAGADYGRLRPMLEAGMAIVETLGDARVFFAGQERLLDYRDMEGSLAEILRLFGHSDEIIERLHSGSGVAVIMGSDRGGIDNVAFVVSSYRGRGPQRGGVGVAGPMRMDYRRVIPRVEFVSRYLEGLMQGS